MCFDNEINTTYNCICKCNATYKYSQTCLSKLRITGIPAIRNKLLGTDFTPLIWKPCCPTPTWKCRNGYVIPIEKKHLTGLRQLLLSCLLNHNGRVKINFLRTMNATVVDRAGHSYRSPVLFFSRLNLVLDVYLLMYTDC